MVSPDARPPFSNLATNRYLPDGPSTGICSEKAGVANDGLTLPVLAGISTRILRSMMRSSLGPSTCNRAGRGFVEQRRALGRHPRGDTIENRIVKFPELRSFDLKLGFDERVSGRQFPRDRCRVERLSACGRGDIELNAALFRNCRGVAEVGFYPDSSSFGIGPDKQFLDAKRRCHQKLHRIHDPAGLRGARAAVRRLPEGKTLYRRITGKKHPDGDTIAHSWFDGARRVQDERGHRPFR
jgi:hypothetical protein